MSYIVYFRGHPACPCQVEWLPAFEHEAQRRGILSGPLPLSQIIGGYSGSGGTHTDGGADDTYPLDGIDVDAYVALSRDMGADATFERPQNWDSAGGVRHVHRVLRGCPHNGPARYQIAAVDAGFNGLGYMGHGAPDDGPRPLSGRTWREGIAWAHQQEDDMARYEDQLNKIEAGVVSVQATLAAQEKKDRDRTRRILDRLATIRDRAKDDVTREDLRQFINEMNAGEG